MLGEPGPKGADGIQGPDGLRGPDAIPITYSEDPLIQVYESLSYQERKMLMEEWGRRPNDRKTPR